jgi:enamine deaminase RidA (YjgF/YER057c/UK114 family)
MNYEEKIKSLNLILPLAPQPAGSYNPVVIHGDLAFLSAQVSKTGDGKILAGKLGRDLTLEEGKQAARAAALNALAIIKDLIGFSKFDRLLRVVGYVQAADNFYEIPSVVNGASDLFLEVFGEKGVHARSAVGMASLPMNAAVELEITLAVKKYS